MIGILVKMMALRSDQAANCWTWDVWAMLNFCPKICLSFLQLSTIWKLLLLFGMQSSSSEHDKCCYNRLVITEPWSMDHRSWVNFIIRTVVFLWTMKILSANRNFIGSYQIEICVMSLWHPIIDQSRTYCEAVRFVLICGPGTCQLSTEYARILPMFEHLYLHSFAALWRHISANDAEIGRSVLGCRIDWSVLRMVADRLPWCIFFFETC